MICTSLGKVIIKGAVSSLLTFLGPGNGCGCGARGGALACLGNTEPQQKDPGPWLGSETSVLSVLNRLPAYGHYMKGQ